MPPHESQVIMQTCLTRRGQKTLELCSYILLARFTLPRRQSRTLSPLSLVFVRYYYSVCWRSRSNRLDTEGGGGGGDRRPAKSPRKAPLSFRVASTAVLKQMLISVSINGEKNQRNSSTGRPTGPELPRGVSEPSAPRLLARNERTRGAYAYRIIVRRLLRGEGERGVLWCRLWCYVVTAVSCMYR